MEKKRRRRKRKKRRKGGGRRTRVGPKQEMEEEGEEKEIGRAKVHLEKVDQLTKNWRDSPAQQRVSHNTPMQTMIPGKVEKVE